MWCICRNITCLKMGKCTPWCLDARQWFSAISHHLAVGGMHVPSCSQIDRNPLTAGYCRQGVQVYSKSPILAVTFYFQSIFFQDSVHFCQLTTRSHLVLELRWIWWSANWDLRQGRTMTYFVWYLEVLCINFKTFNVSGYFQISTHFFHILGIEVRY